MTFFVIFVIAVIIIIYLSKKSNQKNEISKHQQLQDNINRQREKNEGRIKDYLEEEKVKIRVKEETQDIEGVEYNLVNVEAKGFFFGIEKKNTPTKYILHIFDETEGSELLKTSFPVMSHLSEFTDGQSRIFECSRKDVMLNPDMGYSDWSTVLIFPREAIFPSGKGKRKLLFEFYVCNPSATFKSGALVEREMSYSFENAFYDFEYDEVGWRDEYLNRDRVDELCVQLAYVVAAADGKIERSENEIILNWAKSMLIFEKEENYEAKKKQMETATKEAHDQVIIGKLDIGAITEEMNEIAPKTQKYDAIELMLDVCVGDGDIKSVEDKNIELAVKCLKLNWEQYKVMREKRLVNVNIEENESLDEGLFGIIESMSNEEKCKELRVKYNEWKAVTVHNDPATRKQALQMIERIKKLRKKHKC